jgi:hypothetical protein
MVLDINALRRWRISSHYLGNKKGETPLAAAEWLVGIQAQDARGARWAIGLRTETTDTAEVEQAFRDQRILRTWMMRGTLYAVPAADLVWLRPLLAPGIITGNTRRYRQLELDESAIRKSQQILRQALEREGALTRTQIKSLFEHRGVPAEGQQVPYLLQRAALDGLICLGEERKHKPTYRLLPDLSCGGIIARSEALEWLARRYLASRGPATRHDFAWWSGLSMQETRQALEAVSGVTRAVVEGDEYFWIGSPSGDPQKDFAALLPPFDEYLLGYKDRSLVLTPAHAKKVNAGGGMFKPTVMVNGEIVGIWQEQTQKDQQTIMIYPFRKLEPKELTWIDSAVEKYDQFKRLQTNAQVEIREAAEE